MGESDIVRNPGARCQLGIDFLVILPFSFEFQLLDHNFTARFQGGADGVVMLHADDDSPRVTKVIVAVSGSG